MTDPSTFANLSNLVVLAQDDFIGSFWFFVLGGVIVLGLLGLLYYLRTKQDND
jgi:hypothetical protein